MARLYFFLCLVLLPGCADAPSTEMRDTIGDGPSAASICQQFVTDRLKAPATSTFQAAAEATIERVEDSWRVTSHVDAQNGFGALIRTRYTCKVTYDRASRRWTLDALSTQ